jgi:hypothetical protein
MSLTNKIVANIKKTDADVNSFVNTTNVVCIDTSNNRIGINTKTPRYSIDIIGSGPSNMISVNNLLIENIAIIKDISCLNNIDASSGNLKHINYTTISGNSIISKAIVTISANIIDLSISRLKLNDLSATNIDASYLRVFNGGDLSGHIIVRKLTVLGEFSGGTATSFSELVIATSTLTSMTSINSYIQNIDCSTIKVDVSANFRGDVFCRKNIDLSSGSFITLSGNILYANNFRGLTISCERLVTQDCSINGTLQVNKIEDLSGRSIIGEGGALNVNTLGSRFTGLTITETLTIDNNCDISNLRINKKLDFSNVASLIMPTYSSVHSLRQSKSIAIDISDMSMNIIKLYNSNSSWSNIYTKTHYASLDINRELSGNDISSITINAQPNYFIENSNNLIINLANNNKYKYIPLSFKIIGSKIAYSGEGTFKILDISSTSRNGKLKVPDICGVYEINATISMKYLNRIPGDVEPNTYIFGLYNSVLNSDISYIYIENVNNILTFDNSFNYSSSMLNYIGPLFNNSDGFTFLISCTKDLDYLVIDRFNGSIKLLNY